ncbi:NAD(P)H-dependent oxidoreductase [Halomonas nitroreducens]|uniref:NAD(P)H-dependent oxidoreductase n=1 Tax=Halomonas nitroreducens TaxID=447425 RepID=A0A431UZR3_9GAMM|nr:NAD(P)H-dependent oxidoreductase [Halomonas nitroreducens]RTQ99878.1 NAD(P)H-dependent oxidoreductase [Halomonas nitroreducens]
MSLDTALNWRYAAKRMNGQRIPEATLERILDAAHLAPSSYGLQPYSVVVVDDPALRERCRPAAFDQPQIGECSHLLVFATWETSGAAEVDALIRLMARERGLEEASLAGYRETLKGVVNGFASAEARRHWAAKQAYLAMGMVLAAAALERVDATPMEGFDPAALDAVLGLEARRLRSAVVVALGYRDEDADRLAGLKKVRWPRERVIARVA